MRAKSVHTQTTRSRRGRAKRLKRLRALSVVLIIGFFSGGGYAFYRYVRDAEYLRVKRIQMYGLDALDEGTIVAAAGVTRADNILLVNEDDVKTRIERLPYVNRCTVSRVFPDLLIIAIEERKPAAVLLAHGHSLAIDEEGTVLKELGLNEVLPGPYISEVPDLEVVEVGQRPESPSLQAALAVLKVFAGTQTAKEATVAEVAARHPNDLRMYCEELPFEIRWGRGDFENQAARLDRLWNYKGGNLGCTEYCDLRFGRDVACK